jgi:hypothetical protein
LTDVVMLPGAAESEAFYAKLLPSLRTKFFASCRSTDRNFSLSSVLLRLDYDFFVANRCIEVGVTEPTDGALVSPKEPSVVTTFYQTTPKGAKSSSLRPQIHSKDLEVLHCTRAAPAIAVTEDVLAAHTRIRTLIAEKRRQRLDPANSHCLKKGTERHAELGVGTPVLALKEPEMASITVVMLSHLNVDIETSDRGNALIENATVRISFMHRTIGIFRDRLSGASREAAFVIDLVAVQDIMLVQLPSGRSAVKLVLEAHRDNQASAMDLSVWLRNGSALIVPHAASLEGATGIFKVLMAAKCDAEELQSLYGAAI